SGLPRKARHAKGGATQPVNIKADQLVYFNLGREAAYEGHVWMHSDGINLSAERLHVYFSPDPARQTFEIGRVVADGHVRISQPPGRRAQADHAEYVAKSGEIVLTEGPAMAYDAQQGLITGDRLTFSMHDDSLSAEGGKKSQTFSKRRIIHQ
ncbi:MAG: LptA/OstA family protein, partial [Terriglobia bacterium]